MKTLNLESLSEQYGVQTLNELSQEQVDHFRKCGYLYVKNAFDSSRALKIQNQI